MSWQAMLFSASWLMTFPLSACAPPYPGQHAYTLRDVCEVEVLEPSLNLRHECRDARTRQRFSCASCLA